MALKSKTKLFKELSDFHGFTKDVDYTASFEAYGRKVEGYIVPSEDMDLDCLFETIDSLGGFKARKQESCNRVIVRVSYFKAKGWDE